MMSEETKLELIKALAFDMPKEDIANEAGISIEELEEFEKEHANEINERKSVEGLYEE